MNSVTHGYIFLSSTTTILYSNAPTLRPTFAPQNKVGHLLFVLLILPEMNPNDRFQQSGIPTCACGVKTSGPAKPTHRPHVIIRHIRRTTFDPLAYDLRASGLTYLFASVSRSIVYTTRMSYDEEYHMGAGWELTSLPRAKHMQWVVSGFPQPKSPRLRAFKTA